MRVLVALLLLIGLACGAVPDPVEVHPEAAARGAAEARAHMADGTWQILVHGPPQPDDAADAETGLPLRSHGCEVVDEDTAWVEGYNRAVRAAAADQHPFPDDLVIRYAVEGPGVDHRLTITRAEVRYDIDGKKGLLGTITDVRVRAGALAQASRKQVPAKVKEGDTTWSLALERGADRWSATWGTERTIADPRLVEILELWREQASGLP